MGAFSVSWSESSCERVDALNFPFRGFVKIYQVSYIVYDQTFAEVPSYGLSSAGTYQQQQQQYD